MAWVGSGTLGHYTEVFEATMQAVGAAPLRYDALELAAKAHARLNSEGDLSQTVEKVETLVKELCNKNNQ